MMAKEVSVRAAGALVTVMLELAVTMPKLPLREPVMVAVPAATAVANPVELIVATAVFDDVQVVSSVTFCVLLWGSVAV
jgi:hypothetical protein